MFIAIGNWIGKSSFASFVDDFITRVMGDGGVFENSACLDTQIGTLGGFFDRASLVLTPNGRKESKLYSLKPTSGAGDFAFTRASTATRKDSSLVMQVPYNLLSRSEQFDNAIWTKSNTTIVANATTAPSGAVTADNLLETAVTNVHYAVQTVTKPAVSTTLTFSNYVKPNGRTIIFLQVSNGANGISKYFDISAGTLGSTGVAGSGFSFVNATITAAGNGWYRVSLTVTTDTTTSTDNYIGAATADLTNNYLGDITKGIFLWGAQLETSTTTSTYFATTDRFNVPRPDYTPIITRAQGTNLILQSETFDNATWIKAFATITANNTTDPLGGSTADKLLEDNTFNVHYVSQNITKAASATQYTVSVFVKGTLGRDWIRLTVGSGANGYSGWYNVTTGIKGTSAISGTGWTYQSHDITSFGSGWYRCNLTFTTDATTTLSTYFVPATADGIATSYTGDVTKGFYLWGAQLEQTSDLGPYGVTTTVTAPIPAVFQSNPCPSLLLEPQRTNLLLRSEEFDNASWVKSDFTITANSIVSPDGLTTADLCTQGVAGNGAVTQQVTITANNTIAYSSYFKKGNNDWIAVIYGDNALAVNYAITYFNINTGIVGTHSANGTCTLTSKSIDSMGNGWYRVKVTGTVGGGFTAVGVATYAPSGDGVGARVNNATYYQWGAQYEQGAGFVSSYIPTTSATVTRIADAIPQIPVPNTNYVLQSQSFNVSWSAVRSTVTADATTAPDLTATADFLKEDATAGQNHYLFQAITKDAVSRTYTFSLYAKPNGRNWFLLGTYNNALSAGVYRFFDVTNGVMGTASAIGSGWTLLSSSITAAANGFYRCSVTVQTDANTGIAPILQLASGDNVLIYNGDNVSGVYLWGAQVEIGSSVTTYLSTTTTPNSTFIGQTEGTLYWEGNSWDDGTGKYMGLSDGTANNRIHIGFSTANQIEGAVVQGGVVQADLLGASTAFVTGTQYKIALTYQNNKAALFINGVKKLEDLTVTVPPTSKIEFTLTGGTPMYAKQKVFVIIPTALTDAEAIALTT